MNSFKAFSLINEDIDGKYHYMLEEKQYIKSTKGPGKRSHRLKNLKSVPVFSIPMAFKLFVVMVESMHHKFIRTHFL